MVENEAVKELVYKTGTVLLCLLCFFFFFFFLLLLFFCCCCCYVFFVCFLFCFLFLLLLLFCFNVSFGKSECLFASSVISRLGIHPANTQRRHNVAATTRRCNDVVVTLCVYWVDMYQSVPKRSSLIRDRTFCHSIGTFRFTTISSQKNLLKF